MAKNRAENKKLTETQLLESVSPNIDALIQALDNSIPAAIEALATGQFKKYQEMHSLFERIEKGLELLVNASNKQSIQDTSQARLEQFEAVKDKFSIAVTDFFDDELNSLEEEIKNIYNLTFTETSLKYIELKEKVAFIEDMLEQITEETIDAFDVFIKQKYEAIGKIKDKLGEIDQVIENNIKPIERQLSVIQDLEQETAQLIAQVNHRPSSTTGNLIKIINQNRTQIEKELVDVKRKIAALNLEDGEELNINFQTTITDAEHEFNKIKLARRLYNTVVNLTKNKPADEIRLHCLKTFFLLEEELNIQGRNNVYIQLNKFLSDYPNKFNELSLSIKQTPGDKSNIDQANQLMQETQNMLTMINDHMSNNGEDAFIIPKNAISKLEENIKNLHQKAEEAYVKGLLSQLDEKIKACTTILKKGDLLNKDQVDVLTAYFGKNAEENPFKSLCFLSAELMEYENNPLLSEKFKDYEDKVTNIIGQLALITPTTQENFLRVIQNIYNNINASQHLNRNQFEMAYTTLFERQEAEIIALNEIAQNPPYSYFLPRITDSLIDQLNLNKRHLDNINNLKEVAIPLGSINVLFSEQMNLLAEFLDELKAYDNTILSPLMMESSSFSLDRLNEYIKKLDSIKKTRDELLTQFNIANRDGISDEKYDALKNDGLTQQYNQLIDQLNTKFEQLLKNRVPFDLEIKNISFSYQEDPAQNTRTLVTTISPKNNAIPDNASNQQTVKSLVEDITLHVSTDPANTSVKIEKPVCLSPTSKQRIAVEALLLDLKLRKTEQAINIRCSDPDIIIFLIKYLEVNHLIEDPKLIHATLLTEWNEKKHAFTLATPYSSQEIRELFEKPRLDLEEPIKQLTSYDIQTNNIEEGKQTTSIGSVSHRQNLLTHEFKIQEAFNKAVLNNGKPNSGDEEQEKSQPRTTIGIKSR